MNYEKLSNSPTYLSVSFIIAQYNTKTMIKVTKIKTSLSRIYVEVFEKE